MTAGYGQVVQQHKTVTQSPPNQVMKLIERFERERFERYLSEYKRPDYKEARVRAEFIDPFPVCP